MSPSDITAAYVTRCSLVPGLCFLRRDLMSSGHGMKAPSKRSPGDRMTDDRISRATARPTADRRSSISTPRATKSTSNDVSKEAATIRNFDNCAVRPRLELDPLLFHPALAFLIGAFMAQPGTTPVIGSSGGKRTSGAMVTGRRGGNVCPARTGV